MGPLEKGELKAFLADWEKDRRKMVFRRPEWREAPDHAGTAASKPISGPACRCPKAPTCGCRPWSCPAPRR